MADYQPINANGAVPFTCKVGATAVVGGKIVMASGDGLILHSTAAGAATVIGVAAHDAPASGKVSVWPIANVRHYVLAPAGVTAGHGIIAGDAGVGVDAATIATVAAAGTLLGIVEKTVSADAAAMATFVGR